MGYGTYCSPVLSHRWPLTLFILLNLVLQSVNRRTFHRWSYRRGGVCARKRRDGGHGGWWRTAPCGCVKIGDEEKCRRANLRGRVKATVSAARLELAAALMVVVVRGGARLPSTAALGVTTGNSVGVRILAVASGPRWAPCQELAAAPSAARPKPPREAVLGRGSDVFLFSSIVTPIFPKFFVILFSKKISKSLSQMFVFQKTYPLVIFLSNF
jgi:hypothetical protein